MADKEDIRKALGLPDDQNYPPDLFEDRRKTFQAQVRDAKDRKKGGCRDLFVLMLFAVLGPVTIFFLSLFGAIDPPKLRPFTLYFGDGTRFVRHGFSVQDAINRATLLVTLHRPLIYQLEGDVHPYLWDEHKKMWLPNPDWKY